MFFPLVVLIVLLALFTTSAFVPTIPIDESPSKLIVPLFIAFGGFPIASVSALVPLSTLIAIFCLLAILLTVIVPFASFVISSPASTIKTIPVLPLPPDTLISPLFFTLPFHALIEISCSRSSFSITAIPDDNEFIGLSSLSTPASPLTIIVPLFSIVLLFDTREDHFIP